MHLPRRKEAALWSGSPRNRSDADTYGWDLRQESGRVRFNSLAVDHTSQSNELKSFQSTPNTKERSSSSIHLVQNFGTDNIKGDGEHQQTAQSLTDDGGEGAEEGEEGGHDQVEDLVSRHLVREVGVQHSEADGRGQVDVGLQEGDDLGTGVRGSHDEDIFRVAQNRVVEKDEEQHGTEGQQLLERLRCGLLEVRLLVLRLLRGQVAGASGGLQAHRELTLHLHGQERRRQRAMRSKCARLQHRRSQGCRG